MFNKQYTLTILSYFLIRMINSIIEITYSIFMFIAYEPKFLTSTVLLTIVNDNLQTTQILVLQLLSCGRLGRSGHRRGHPAGVQAAGGSDSGREATRARRGRCGDGRVRRVRARPAARAGHRAARRLLRQTKRVQHPVGHVRVQYTHEMHRLRHALELLLLTPPPSNQTSQRSHSVGRRGGVSFAPSRTAHNESSRSTKWRSSSYCGRDTVADVHCHTELHSRRAHRRDEHDQMA